MKYRYEEIRGYWENDHSYREEAKLPIGSLASEKNLGNNIES
jgi:hypothetical protein